MMFQESHISRDCECGGYTETRDARVLKRFDWSTSEVAVLQAEAFVQCTLLSCSRTRTYLISHLVRLYPLKR